jgi:outer membrane protein TolC
MRFRILFLFLLVIDVASNVYTAGAQEFLSLDSAIAHALRNNYDVRIADVTNQIAGVNNAIGNAGLLPGVNGTSNINGTITNTHLERSDNGGITDRAGAKTTNVSAGLNGTYTIFAAGRAWLIYEQLGRREDWSAAQLKAQIQATISAVIQSYAGVVNDQRQAVAIDTAISLAKVRMDLSQAKYNIGTSAKVDYLQARVDYNAAHSQLFARLALLADSRAQLNQTMGEDAEWSYSVQDSLPLNLSLQATDSSLLRQNSPILEAQRINTEIAKLDTRIFRTYYYPQLDANLGYGYSLTTSDASLLRTNRTYGPNGGLTLNVPLFQGGNIRRQVKVASLNEMSAELQYYRQERAISREYRSAWAAYENAVAVFRLEEENIGYAKENLDIQQARFRVGVANSLEIREAENSYVAALARLNAAAYSVKINETKVLEIEAKLVE